VQIFISGFNRDNNCCNLPYVTSNLIAFYCRQLSYGQCGKTDFNRTVTDAEFSGE